MKNTTFQGRFRPLVNRAWEAQAHLTGCQVHDKTARETWYRSTLEKTIHKTTTSGVSDTEQMQLLHTFAAIAEAEHEVPVIRGWTEAQNMAFEELALEAWDKHGRGLDKDFRPWLQSEIWEFVPGWKASKGKAGRTDTFDLVMGHLALIADNGYWIKRTAEQSEIRLRWAIRMKLKDLEELTGEPHHWSYVRSIWKQSQQLPTDIMDAPATLLHPVFCMLDTHVRRLAERMGEDFRFLPSRMAAAQEPPTL
jgi:hypothetical protein